MYVDAPQIEWPEHVIKDIEDIQMFLLNMAFISSSEVQNIYIS